jgi:transcriptional regulator with XRE-family HTH domain
MQSTFADRVKGFRKHKKLSQAAFAEQCGLEQGNITQMENGTEPKQSNISKLISGFPDLNAHWLLTGAGEMLADGRTLTAVATKAEPVKAALLSASETVEEASAIVKLAQVEEANRQLRERLEDAKEEILWLRGKSYPSSYAAAEVVEPLKMRRWHDVAAQTPKPEGKHFIMHPEASDAELAA